MSCSMAATALLLLPLLAVFSVQISLGQAQGPTITTQPQDQVVATASSVMFMISTTGTAPLTYEWQLGDGSALPSNLRFTGGDSDTLVIATVTKTDPTSYQCVVTDGGGMTMSDVATLTVLDPPVIFQEPFDHLLKVPGMEITFSVAAMGDDLVFDDWKRTDGSPLPDTSVIFVSPGINTMFVSLLTISNVAEEDEGMYQVSVSNGVGMATSIAAQLTVLDPPVIITQPPDQLLALPGMTAIFTVIATGDNLVYRWERVSLPPSLPSPLPSLSSIYIGGNTTTLTISNVAEEHEGIYQCVISNNITTVASSGTQFTVLDPPIITTEPFDQLLLVPGVSAIFAVTATGDSLVYQWERIGGSLPTAATGVNTADLTIPSTAEEDEGMYRCVVSNDAAIVTSSAAELTVLDPPVITSQPTDLLLVVAGTMATFHVGATGDQLTYQWERVGASLPSEATGANTASLTLSNLMEGDEGMYQCVISNNASTVTSDASLLTVLDPPVITTQPSDQLLRVLGTTAMFTVVATGDNLVYQWEKNMMIIMGAVSSTYTISNVTEEDEGMYRCVVTNAADTVYSDAAELTVYDLGSGSLCYYAGNVSYNFTIVLHDSTQSVSVSIPLGAFRDIATGIYYTIDDVILYENYSQAQQCPFATNYDSLHQSFLVLTLFPNLDSDMENHCLFILTLFPEVGAPFYCLGTDIIVAATIIVELPPPVCTGANASLEGSQYDSISNSLEVLNCSIPDSTEPVLYVVGTDNEEILAKETEFSPILADYFYPDTYEIVVTVCRYDQPNICSNNSLNVILTVYKHSGRLFPFGANLFDSSLDYADDRAAPVVVPNRIPFWSQYHIVVYLSTNGLASFGFPFTSWYPVPFPYGRTLIPIVAPYWNDLDFRNSVPESALYYNVYETNSMRGQAIITDFSDRLRGYNETFSPEWLLISTWNKATPYYGQSNEDETLTFQLILATDYVKTFAFFLYEEDGINWNSYRQARRIVIGFDAKDFQNYNNVELDSLDYLNIDDIIGNTGRKGQWYFDLTEDSSETDNTEQLCLTWANSQPDHILSNFEGISSCPGTRVQAQRDWRFFFGSRWGFSSRPECATLLFSGTRSQSSVECCYDDAGSLMVGPKDGGSYKLYNSLFFPTEYYIHDLLPYEQCCRLSDRCTTYYKYRPSDDGSGYIAPRPTFMWGDPHFQSVDGVEFTFNGIGEYILLEAPIHQLEVQVRFVPFDDTTMATVTTGVAIQYMNSLPIEVLINRTTRELQLYTDGNLQSTPDSEGIIVVTQSNTYNDVTAFLESGVDLSDLSVVTIISDSEQLIVTIGSGTASIMVAPQNTFLRTTLELSDDFIDDTHGLLGIYNRDPTDDFTLPDGNSISIIDSTEYDVYYMFGRAWHVNSTEYSLFSYSSGDNYALYNDEFDGYVPTFSDAVTVDPPPECEDDHSCIYDFFVSNSNMELGVSTLEAARDNRYTEIQLDNHPPSIIGPTTLVVTAGVAFSAEYIVEDADSHTVDYFTLMVFNHTDITLDCIVPYYYFTLHWPVPGFDLPSSSIQLFSNDTLGASTTHTLHIVLCGCFNGGECVEATDDEQLFFNDYGHYKLPCLCTENFTGDSCEIDTRGCDIDPCPDYSICTVNNSVPDGYICTMCEDGYFLDAEEKCTDIDECSTVDPDQWNNCDQLCINTDGSYECGCILGYRLSYDGRTCTDIDECEEQLDECAQFCINTIGSYTCDCLGGYVLGVDRICRTAPCHPALCDGLSCALEGDIISCHCSAGEKCSSISNNCMGSESEIGAADLQCTACPEGYYGFECSRSCLQCGNGQCDASVGCVCNPGWEGFDCNTEVNLFSPEFDPATPSVIELPWDVPALSPIVTISATDNDSFSNPNLVSYHLIHANNELPIEVSDGIGVFKIDSVTGLVRLIADLNTTRGQYSKFILTIEAQDNGILPRTMQHLLVILPIAVALPIPQFSQSVYTTAINEGLINEAFLTITCKELSPAGDPDKLAIVLLPGSDSEFFVLENGSSIAVIKELDYEKLDPDYPVYSIMLQCTNQYNLSTTTEILIEIRNDDDNPFTFENSTYFVTIPENTARNTEVYIVTASDADEPNMEVFYTLIDQSGLVDFDIDQKSGRVYVSSFNELDRERISRYNLTLEASDTAVTVTATIIIELSDVNDERPIFDQGVYTIAELSTQSQTGDIVVVVNAADNDIGSNAEITYSLEVNEYFIIDSITGVVRINVSSVPSGHYRLTVYARDSGQPSLTGTTLLDIIVRPSPSQIQIELESLSFSVQENASIGYTIGFVRGNVTENGEILSPNQIRELQYNIVSGANVTIFHLIHFSGEIILLDSLDYESIQYYPLRIEVFVPDEPLIASAEVTITISVTDINDNLPVFIPSFYATTVEEFTDIGSSVLTVNAQDEDDLMNGEVHYRLENSTDIPFSINSTTGIVYIEVNLDTSQDYRFNVIAEDRGDPTLSSEAVVFISVIRSRSVTVQFTEEEYRLSVSENATIGSFIGTVRAISTSNNDSIAEYDYLEYRIRIIDFLDSVTESGNGNDYFFFNIDELTGMIHSLTTFDRESQDTYVFHVEVLDTNTSMVVADASVRVTIIDVNDNSPVFLQSLYTVVITESTPPQTTIVKVEAFDGDGDANGQIEYRLESGVLGFDIDPSSGNVSIANATLRVGEYLFMALAFDSGNLRGSATIFVAVISSFPGNISFTEDEYNFSVLENSEPGTVIGMIQAVDSSGQPLTSNIQYTLDNSTCLHIGPLTGYISVLCNDLDREQQSCYEFVVIANYTCDLDNGRPRYGEVKVVVDVADENDNPPVFTRVVYADVILDTHGTATPVLTVEARDHDVGENAEVIYKLVKATESDNDTFVLNETSGDIYLTSAIVQPGDYMLMVTARDNGSPDQLESLVPATVLISIDRGSPAGLIFSNTSFFISESQTTGSFVGTVELLNHGTVVVPMDYSLTFSLLDEESFTIDSESGDIYTLGTLDREVEASHVFVVRAVFADFDITVEAHVTITVTDENDNSPFFSQLLYSGEIDTSFEVGTIVPTLVAISADDIDEGTNSDITYSIDPGLPFDINSTTGVLLIADTSLRARDYRFTIFVSDMGNPPFTGEAEVFIIVMHALPTFISFPPFPFVFNHTEESAAGTLVGVVAVEQNTPALVDLDYDIVGSRDYFLVDSTSGNITNSRRIDRETFQQLNITIKAFFPGDNISSLTDVTVNIVDINDNRPTFDPDVYHVTVFASELSTTTPLVNLSVMDPDVGANGEIVFQLRTVNNSSNSLFSVSGNGMIFVRATDLAPGTYQFEVDAVDRGNPVQTGTAIVVINIETEAPTLISFTETTYQFNTSEYTPSGSLIGRVELQSLEEDFKQFISYTTMTTDFVISPIAGEIYSSIDFDFELQQCYVFTVRAVLDVPHREILFFTETVLNISIDDENDNYPQFVNFPSLVQHNENQSQAIVVGDIDATDRDSGVNSVLSFAIANDVRNRFSINSMTGEIIMAESLDREELDYYQLIITVTDSGIPPRVNISTLTIELLDINDNPPNLDSGLTYEIAERIEAYTEVLQFEGSDLDIETNGDFIFLSHGSGWQGVFSINESTGVLILEQELDYEMQNRYYLELMLQDNPMNSDGIQNTQIYNITINVIDRPDTVPSFQQSSYESTTSPSVSTGDILVIVTATDADGDSLTYSITGITHEGNNSEPRLDINSDTGKVFSTADQVFSPGAVFTLTVEAADDSEWNLSISVRVRIEVLPEVLEFTKQIFSVFVYEDAPANSTVGELTIRPRSISSDIQYTIEVSPSGNDNKFRADAIGSGSVVLLNGQLDREIINSYSIVVIATSPGESTTAMLLVEVLDVNDNYPIFSDSNTLFEIEENIASPTTVTVVSATDADTGSNAELEYSIINPLTLPFAIDLNTGTITVSGEIDYETDDSFTLMVEARDKGSPALSSTITITVNVINLNDNFPQFSAPAYFGEVYAEAPANYRVHHVILSVSDDDDQANQQPLSFVISISPGSEKSGYGFVVSDTAPYYVIAVSIPDNAVSEIVTFAVEVADEGDLRTTVPLYLSIFTSKHLIPLILNGIMEQEFLFCLDASKSVCEFKSEISRELTLLIGSNITVYNDTISESADDPQQLLVSLYSWYGDIGVRDSSGELTTHTKPAPVMYLVFEDNLQSIQQAVAVTESYYNTRISIVDNNDRCPAETTTLMIATTATFSWPVTEAGVTECQPCPGSHLNTNVSRHCGRSLSSGPMWSEVDFSQCSVWVATLLENETSQPEDLQPEILSEIVQLTDTVLTEAAIVDPRVAEQYLDIIDSIQQVNISVIQESEEQSDTSLSSSIIESLGRFQDEVVPPPNATNGSLLFTRSSFAVQIRDIDVSSFDGETFSIDLGSLDEALNRSTPIPKEAIKITVDALVNVTASITVPPNLIMMGVNQSMESQRLSYSVFLTDTLFQSPNQTAQNLSIETVITAVRLKDFIFHEAVQILVNSTFSISERVKNAKSNSCVQWEGSDRFGEWSNDSCRLVESGREEIICECSIHHPSSHFAVLFDLNPSPPSLIVGIALEVISYVGLIISALSLIIMIVTYLHSKDLRTSHHGQIVLNICTSLLCLYIMFLIAGHVTGVPALCGVVSALLHYFILVFFGWTATEAVYLYIKLVIVQGTDKYVRGFTWKAGITVWLIPILIVAISLSGYQFYHTRYYCRPTQWPFFFGLILPVVLIITFNWVIFIVILASVFRNSAFSATKDEGRFKVFKRKLITAMVLAVMFGLGWGLGLLATSTAVQEITTVFQIIFALFVGSQGLLLLIFHGFRSEKARATWKQCFNTVFCRHVNVTSITSASAFNSDKRLAADFVPSYHLTTLDTLNSPEIKSISSPSPKLMETTTDIGMIESTVVVNLQTGYGQSYADTNMDEGYLPPHTCDEDIDQGSNNSVCKEQFSSDKEAPV